MMMVERLNELLARFPSKRIAVVGDYFLDKYLDFDPELAEISLETGKPANQVVNIRHSPGAAGTVVCNLVALRAGEVVPIGFTGDDGEGYDLRQDLAKLGCQTKYLLTIPERRTPTYLKPQNIRVPGLEGEQERYDTKNRDRLPTEVERRILDSVRELLPDMDAVIVADQVEEENRGVITDAARAGLAEMADEFPAIVFWADSRRRIGLFRNMILKPNQREAVKAVFPNLEGSLDYDLVQKAGRRLVERSGKPIFMTRQEQGIIVFDRKGSEEIRGVRVEGPTDPTGAGDSVTAGAVLTLAAGGTLAEAALMAVLVASITIQQLGVTGIAHPDQLPARLELWREQE